MKIINSAFNIAFARAMAKRNNPESPAENSVYVGMGRTPGSKKIESKAAIASRAAYSKRVYDFLNDR